MSFKKKQNDLVIFHHWNGDIKAGPKPGAPNNGLFIIG
jgi:hypothetical protein